MMNEKGFTLVELMLVVAIIGVLSTVTLPVFSKFQAKSKLIEAKVQLSALYIAEASFFTNYNMYHNCLAFMGFDPGPEAANRYFAVGINVDANTNSTAYATALNSGLNAADCPETNTVNPGGVNAVSPNRATWFPADKGIGNQIANTPAFITDTALGDQSNKTQMTYTAGAGGIVSKDFNTAGTSAMITIDQNKVMKLIRSGF